MKNIITLICLFCALQMSAQSTYPFEVTDDVPCNLSMGNKGGDYIYEQWLVDEITWVEKQPNFLAIRDDERTFTIREDEIGFLIDDRTGIFNPPPNTIGELVNFLETIKTGCMNRIVGDTIILGLDSIVVGGASDNIYTADGTQTDNVRTYNLGLGATSLYWNSPNGDDRFYIGSPTPLAETRIYSNISRLYTGLASLELIGADVLIGGNFNQTTKFEVQTDLSVPTNAIEFDTDKMRFGINNSFATGIFDVDLAFGARLKISDGVVGYGVPGAVLTSDGTFTTWQLPTPVTPPIWENVAGFRQIIALGDTSVQIKYTPGDHVMLLNDANIGDNKDRESPPGTDPTFESAFGAFLTTSDRYDASFLLNPGTSVNVWANTNPLERTYRWRDNYINREQNFILPGGAIGEQNYSSVLNSDGNIWMMGFDFGAGYMINPTDNSIERTTEGVAITGQSNINTKDGLNYVTQISFNPVVINTQLREFAILAFPAFDVSAGFTKFNTYFGGSISSFNNGLYQAPYASSQETRVAKFDIDANTGGYLAGNINISGAGEFEYTACVEAVDGKIYCMPYNNDFLLEIDPASDTWIQWGDGNANPVVTALRGGWALINHPNGKMYAPPFVGARTLEIDPVAKTIVEIGGTYPAGGANDMKWASAALHQNGKIYCFPFTDAIPLGVLEIDPATGTTTLLPITTSHAYWGTKVAENGSIWGLPQTMNNTVTRIDLASPPIYPTEFVTAPQFQSR